MSRYRMIALDIDGTTLNSRGELSTRTRGIIARALNAGMLVTIATGRSWRAALPVADALDISAPLVVSNGALVISPVTGQILDHRPLKRTVAVDAVRVLQRMGFAPFASRCALTGPDLFYEQAPAVPEAVCLLRRRPEHVQRVYDLAGWVAGMQPLKVMTLDRTDSVTAAADRLQRDLTGPFQVLVTHEAPGYSLLEIAPPDVSKATGLERVAALNRIDPSEVIAFGDNYNDLEMLQWAGTGVAMGNAPDGVKLAADTVTGSNDEDGVAWFLEQHVFKVA